MLPAMGQNNSVSKHRRRSFRSPFLPKRSHKSSLSHTFSLSHDDRRIEQLNINLATEEELMTLSGVTREIARGIVRHRQVIGRFRKVEDLALVAGIGAERLDRIRGEICVRGQSCGSSRTPSYDSLGSAGDGRARHVVDVNKASVFDLQCINGMTQEMAANIVQHRNKRGPFKKVDDLLKVRSINPMRYGNMCHYLTVGGEDRNANLPRTNGIPNGVPVEHKHEAPRPTQLFCKPPPRTSNGCGMPSPSSLGDIFELLSAYSCRPIPEEDFRYERNGRHAFRAATWNLHEFTCEKARNLGVREVVCRTILENKWSVICVQDVLEEEALQLICEELNSPRLRKVSEVRTNSHEWKCTSLDSHVGFIYDAHSGGLGVELMSVLEHRRHDSYNVAIAEFSVGLLNVQMTSLDILEGVDVATLEKELVNLGSTYSKLVVAGNFTKLEAGDGCTEIGDMRPALPLSTNTGYGSTNCRYGDNVLVSNDVGHLMTGIGGVVRQGLTHLAIPDGWSWGGPASPHCPVWTEFYLSGPSQNGF